MTFDSSKHPADHPLFRLGPEDLNLVLELVLAGGSLKDVAGVYGVSYPTIRKRVDELIERTRAAAAGRRPDPLSDLLADLMRRGEISPGAARAVKDLTRTLAADAHPADNHGAH